MEHHKEIAEYLSIRLEEPVYMAVKGDGLIGFLEASIHRMGSHAVPIGYIEGWYAEEEFRRIGVGKNLVTMAEAWALSMGFSEMGSDAEVTNHVSIGAHKRLGYEEITRDETEVKFLKGLIG